MPRHIYLDTSIFLPQLWYQNRDERRYTGDIIGSLRGQVSNHDDFAVRIPQICVGEAATRYLEEHNQDNLATGTVPPNDEFLDNLYSILDDTNGELVSADSDSHEIAQRLTRADRDVKDNDALIVGVALDDPHSTHLLTTDGALFDTEAVRQVEEGMNRVHSLTITDSYG